MTAGNLAMADFTMAGTWVQHYNRDTNRLTDPMHRYWCTVRVPYNCVSDVVLDIYRTGPSSPAQIAHKLMAALRNDERVRRTWDLDKMKLTQDEGTAVHLRLVWIRDENGEPANPLMTNNVGDLIAEAADNYAMGPKPDAKPSPTLQPQPHHQHQRDISPEMVGLRAEYKQLTGKKAHWNIKRARLAQIVKGLKQEQK